MSFRFFFLLQWHNFWWNLDWMGKIKWRRYVWIMTNYTIFTTKSLSLGPQYKDFLKLTSFSEVPQTAHDLHSMHCQGYLSTEVIIFGVNWRQVGWPDRPHSEQLTRRSDSPVFLFSSSSPLRLKGLPIQEMNLRNTPPLIQSIISTN